MNVNDCRREQETETGLEWVSWRESSHKRSVVKTRFVFIAVAAALRGSEAAVFVMRIHCSPHCPVERLTLMKERCRQQATNDCDKGGEAKKYATKAMVDLVCSRFAMTFQIKEKDRGLPHRVPDAELCQSSPSC